MIAYNPENCKFHDKEGKFSQLFLYRELYEKTIIHKNLIFFNSLKLFKYILSNEFLLFKIISFHLIIKFDNIVDFYLCIYKLK